MNKQGDHVDYFMIPITNKLQEGLETLNDLTNKPYPQERGSARLVIVAVYQQQL